eukprot:m.14794 g.14794  ORF g.14794 m.14794 type:complete len:853 (-) comp6508_c0_seq1:36-2594(-)
MAGRLRAPVVTPANELIDITTKVSIRTASDQVDIFYTINGQVPNPFQVIGEKFTIKYTKPFTLPLGKRAIKAVCVSKVHKTAEASPLVTKFYQVVEKLPTASDDGEIEEEEENGDTHPDEIVPIEQAKHLAREMTAALMQGTLRDTDVFHQWRAAADGPESQGGLPEKKEAPKQRQYCTVCNARRGSDAIQCSVCGTQFPDALLPKKETSHAHQHPHGSSTHTHHGNSTHQGHHLHATSSHGQPQRDGLQSPRNIRTADEHHLIPTIKCPFCTAALRPDARFCLSCQNRLPDTVAGWATAQGDTAAARKLVDCRGCGVRNLATLTHCTHCDTKLITAPPPDAPRPCACPSCGRVNAADARYCSGCGHKTPIQAQQLRVCAVCSLENALGARYCNDCGTLLAPEAGEYDVTRRKAHPQRPYFQDAVPVTRMAVDAITQTDAILDPPGAATLRKEKKSSASSDSAAAVPYQPGMTSIGKGYWRQQIDHLAGSLKHFTRESAPFQAALGQPLMSDVIRARVDEDGDEVAVTVVLRRVPPPSKQDPATATAALPSSSLLSSARTSSLTATGLVGRDRASTSSATQRESTRLGTLREEESVGTRRQPSSDRDRTINKAGHTSATSSSGGTVGTAVAAGAQRRGGSEHEDDGWHVAARDAKGGKQPTRRAPASASQHPNSTSETLRGPSSREDREIAREDLSGAGSMRGQPTKHSQQLMMELSELGQGREDEVLSLLDSGADPNTARPDKQRALHLAARRGFHKCIQLLLDSNADLNATDRKGDTALHAAVTSPVHAQECIEILLQAGADVTIKNNDGLTPAALAVASGQRQLAVLIGSHLSRSVVDSFAHTQRKPRS